MGTLIGMLLAQPAPGAPLEPEKLDLFIGNREDYHTYRIPSLAVTTKGTVLAFCEGRKSGASDAGDVDLFVRRSTDGGRTFEPQRVVWDEGANTCGNPCPVVDGATGTIWLLMTHNLGQDSEKEIVEKTGQSTRTVWISKSTDDGATWSPPIDITSTTKKPDWTWYATGPGAGIQMRSGRLVIPCDHRGQGGMFSHVIFSDDHGATWKIGDAVGPFCNECEVVELSNGKLLLNMRNYNPQRSSRAIATSGDGGQTWSPIQLDRALIEPTCQASLRRISWPESGKSHILFSNPASQTARVNLTIHLSTDECKTWPESKVLEPGPVGYSCLAVLPGGAILCFYENGVNQPYEQITLARFSLDWLAARQ